MIYLVYPNLQVGGTLVFESMAMAYADRSLLKDRDQIENVLSLPGYFVLDSSSKSRLQNQDGVYLAKVKGRQAPTDVSNLIVLEARRLTPDQGKRLARDLKTSTNSNYGWNDHDRDRDRDRDKDHDKPVMTWWGMNYTFEEALVAFERPSTWGYASSKDAQTKVHDLAEHLVNGSLRSTSVPKDLVIRFVQDLFTKRIQASPATLDLICHAILAGRLRLGFAIETEAASFVLSHMSIMNPGVVHEMHDFFARYHESLPHAGPLATTLYSYKDDLDRLPPGTSVRQPIPQAFVDNPKAMRGHAGFVNFSAVDIVALFISSAANHQCNFNWQALYFLKHLYRLDGVAFVPFMVDLTVIRNHFLLHDKHEFRVGSAEDTLDMLLKDKSVWMIFIDVHLSYKTGSLTHRFVHSALSELGLPGVPAIGDRAGHTAHANTLLLDKRNTSFTLFEPHRRDTEDTATTHAAKVKVRDLEGSYKAVKDWAEHLGYKEAGYVCTRTPGERGVQGQDSLCASWSLFYTALQMVNPLLPEALLRPAMSFSTLSWFLYFLYARVRNLGQKCTIQTRDGSDHAPANLEWKHGERLYDMVKNMKNLGDYLYSMVPLKTRKSGARAMVSGELLSSPHKGSSAKK